MKSLTLVLVVGLALSGSGARGADLVKDEGWCQVAAPGFTIVSQVKPSETAAWAGRVSQFVDAMKGRLPGDRRALGPLTIVLFGSRSDFWKSAPLLKEGDPMHGLGAFHSAGGWGATVGVYDDGSSEDTQRLLLNCVVEWLMSANHQFIPIALRSGLGNVYGAYSAEDNEEVFGRPPRNWVSALRSATNDMLSTNGRFLKVDALLAVKDMNLVAERHGVSIFMVESWGFAHFLLFSKDMSSRHAMDRLLDAFAHHAAPQDALRQAFGDDAGSINSLFLNYINGGDFYEMRRPLVNRPPREPPAPASQALVAMTLARVNVASRRLEAARAYAEKAVTLAPGDPRSHDALALVAFDQRRHDEVAAECKKALDLNTRDGWTWYLESLEVGRSAGDTPLPLNRLTAEDARAAMNGSEMAILRLPGLEAAYRRLAALVPFAARITEDDGRFIQLGCVLLPNDGFLQIGRAQWARRLHENPLALQILDDLLAHSDSYAPAVSARARALKNAWTSGD